MILSVLMVCGYFAIAAVARRDMLERFQTAWPLTTGPQDKAIAVVSAAIWPISWPIVVVMVR